MVEKFSFVPGGTLHFGRGEFRNAGEMIQGKRVLLVSGKSFLASEQYKSVASLMKFNVIVPGEPEPDFIDETVSRVRGKVDLVLAVGGGSALDAGKAIAAMCCADGSVEEYLEDVGSRKPSGETLPVIAVPTTAGTGSEATKNAVICRRGADGYKKSLRHDNYIPRTVIIDPDLYFSCPSGVMASCGFDAFSQLLEAYISTKANSYTDTLAWKGLTLFLENFTSLVWGDGRNLERMEKIAFAAYLSGICLANAGLGTIHGIAGPLGGFFTIPHGTACGTLLPEVIRRTAEKQYVFKLEKLGRHILGMNLVQPGSDPADAVTVLLNRWLELLSIPRLSSFGITEDDAERIAAVSGNKNNPVLFSREEIASIIKARL